MFYPLYAGPYLRQLKCDQGKSSSANDVCVIDEGLTNNMVIQSWNLIDLLPAAGRRERAAWGN